MPTPSLEKENLYKAAQETCGRGRVYEICPSALKSTWYVILCKHFLLLPLLLIAIIVVVVVVVIILLLFYLYLFVRLLALLLPCGAAPGEKLESDNRWQGGGSRCGRATKPVQGEHSLELTLGPKLLKRMDSDV